MNISFIPKNSRTKTCESGANCNKNSDKSNETLHRNCWNTILYAVLTKRHVSIWNTAKKKYPWLLPGKYTLVALRGNICDHMHHKWHHCRRDIKTLLNSDLLNTVSFQLSTTDKVQHKIQSSSPYQGWVTHIQKTFIYCIYTNIYIKLYTATLQDTKTTVTYNITNFIWWPITTTHQKNISHAKKKITLKTTVTSYSFIMK